jgi:broad specificity phosphatase PhoE
VHDGDAGRHDLLLVRHGETAWSRSGQHTGRTDLELTNLGRRQARALGRRLRGRRFALVLTSPLRRARDTARLAGFGTAEPTEDLFEWDYGEYEGLTTPQIRQRVPGWSVWRDGVSGGETAEQVAARCDRVIARVRAADGDALVFAHGHLLRVLAARWLGLPARDGHIFKLDAATLSVLGYEHEWPAVELWNDRAHLDPRPPARSPTQPNVPQ